MKHGTSLSRLESIQKNGLQSNTQSNWSIVPSIGGFVYLTNQDFQAYFHATRTAVKDNCDVGVILHLDVDDANLYPDENYFVSDLATPSWEEMLRSQLEILNSKDEWHDCLISLGMLAHKGDIPSERIVSYEKFNIKDSPFWSFVNSPLGFDETFTLYQRLIHLGQFNKYKGLSDLEIVSKFSVVSANDDIITIDFDGIKQMIRMIK